MRIRFYLFGLLSFLCLAPVLASAQGGNKIPGASHESVAAFRKVKNLSNLNLTVPTVLEVPFEGLYFERTDVAVLNLEAGNFEPYFLKADVQIRKTPVTITASGSTGSAFLMSDGNTRTFTEFALPETLQGEAKIYIKSLEPITASGLSILLDNNVALPNSIDVRANTSLGESIVVAPQELRSTTIRFPAVASTHWTITLKYGQLLRIAEFQLIEENAVQSTVQKLRFLAQPRQNYQVYFDADRAVDLTLAEAGNLTANQDVVALPLAATYENPAYKMADGDRDGIADIRDNCVLVANFEQVDINKNGRGDICDDFDKDGIINNLDNCPNLPNSSQEDTDGDKLGDVCDKEESRVTEKHKWVPWLGIGFAALVLVALFAVTAKSMNKKEDPTNPPTALPKG